MEQTSRRFAARRLSVYVAKFWSLPRLRISSHPQREPGQGYSLLMPRMEIRFSHIDAGRCTVDWRMYSRNDSLLARVTVVPLAGSVMRKRAAAGLARLKKLLEAS